MYQTKKFDRVARQWSTYPSRHKTKEASLIEAYEEAIQEAATLSADEGKYGWFEVEMDFEITDSYLCEGLEDISYFPVAVIYYDKAPWDRENDCEIRIMSGYIPEAISEDELENEQKSLSDSKMPARPDRPSVKVFETASDTFIFSDTVDLEEISSNVMEEWEASCYRKSYKQIIQEKYGDAIIRVSDKKRVLW